MNLCHWSIIGPALADGFKIRENDRSNWEMYEKVIGSELHLIEISAETNQLYRIVTSKYETRSHSRFYLDGPSFECFSDQGDLCRRIYSEHGRPNRDPALGPAEEVNQVGLLGPFPFLNTKKYVWKGALHRVDGPAIITTSPCGTKIHEEYWLNGIRTK